ncbi:hypothetical protein EI555_021472 [Monodon monoceros]|uniref:glycerophosphocholine cholinephosphodiesterase n=1 Tax=Monodon monoceros TaxID=40151 RepID=A0A4U1FPS2_MONMO|nr:hypothetical protein EI555_021472 [Monodon monoceros]
MAEKLRALLLALVLSLAQPAPARRKLLVFLLDGFRSDYISDEVLESLPGFREIWKRNKIRFSKSDSSEQKGTITVSTEKRSQGFESLLHELDTTVTTKSTAAMKGRHCEVHQMIGNYMWDPATNKSFDIGVNRDSLMPLWWNGSEPLWITLTKAKRKVYMYYWPGCEVEILGVRPTYCLEYKNVPTDINFANAVSDALDFFKSGQADLVAIYYERIDVEGHHYGPSSPQRKEALRAVDTVLKYMTTWIQERELQDDLNVIIFSDHGMTDIFWMDKVIELDKYISLHDLRQVKDRGPVVSLWPAPGKHSEARRGRRQVEVLNMFAQASRELLKYETGKNILHVGRSHSKWLLAKKFCFPGKEHHLLSPIWHLGTCRLQDARASTAHELGRASFFQCGIYNKLRTVEHMTVYKKEAIPSRFYYKKGKFVSPLTLVADEGWFITERIQRLGQVTL